MWSSLSPQRRRFVAVAAGLVVIAAIAGTTIALVSGSSGSTPARPVSQQENGPVVLVPGYGGSTSALDSLATYLQQRGRTTVVVSLPDGGVGDLAAQARTLKATVTAELQRTGARSVDVVGYSAGGVVARLWVRNDGGGSLARRVVTLGSPQHGTDLAGLAGQLVPGACPTACQQLQPDSELLAQLNQGDETPAGPSWVSFYTDHDTVVVPAESAELNGALNIQVQSVCADSTVNHSQLPTNKLMQAMVATELAPGNPVPLTAADCARLR